MTTEPMTKAERAAIIDRINARLEANGLYVVSVADKAVLDAVGQIRDEALYRLRKDNGGSVADAIDAELARREGKP